MIGWTTRTTGRRTGADMASDADGAVIAELSAVEKPSYASWLRVSAVLPDGDEAWQTSLTMDGFDRAPQIALTRSAVLVAWDVEAEGGARSLRWIAFDRATGAPRPSFEIDTPLGLLDRLEVAAAAMGGQFALVWQVATPSGDRQRPDIVTHVAVVSPTGEIIDAGEIQGLEQVAAVAPSADGLVLLSSGFRSTRVDLVDLKALSIERSIGFGGPYSDLHLVSADGRLYVTWSPDRGQPYIATIDPGGAISPALALDYGDMKVGGGMGGPAVVHEPYIAPPRVDRFRCRIEPGGGAPARLGPPPAVESPFMTRSTITATGFTIATASDPWALWAVLATLLSFSLTVVTAGRMSQRALAFGRSTPTLEDERGMQSFRRLVAQHTSARAVLVLFVATFAGLSMLALAVGAPEVPWIVAVGGLSVVVLGALTAVSFMMWRVRATPSAAALRAERDAIVKTWTRSVFPPWGPSGR
jgi:hypothetical protein